MSALCGALANGGGAAEAQSGGQGSGAAISLSKNVVQPGQRVFVTLTGWRTRQVTLSVCGNLARRGSGDCDLIASQSLVTNGVAATLTEFTVFPPPGTCPCVIRASSVAQDEVVVAPIEIVGVPVGPIVAPEFKALLDVAVRVRPGPNGFMATLRAALGGASSYRVAVSVHNLTAETLPALSATGSVGHSTNETLASFDESGPPSLGPGATWTFERRVTLPAPVISRFTWQVTVSGAGPPVSGRSSTHRLPLGFVVLAVIFIGDVVGMIWYFTARHFRRRRADIRQRDSRQVEEPHTMTIDAALLS